MRVMCYGAYVSSHSAHMHIYIVLNKLFLQTLNYFRSHLVLNKCKNFLFIRLYNFTLTSSFKIYTDLGCNLLRMHACPYKMSQNILIIVPLLYYFSCL